MCAATLVDAETNKTKAVAEAALRRSSGPRPAGGNSEEGEGAGRRGVRYMTSPVKRELFANHMYIEHRLNLGVVDRKVRVRSVRLGLGVAEWAVHGKHKKNSFSNNLSFSYTGSERRHVRGFVFATRL